MKTNRRRVLAALSGAAGSVMWRSGALAAADPPAASNAVAPARETVTGIGGVFFRAQDPAALAKWYEDHLGVTSMPTKANDPVWRQDAGETVFAPFPATTPYFGDATKQWMLNFRVRDLDKMAAQLEAAGIAIKIDPTVYPNGRFARIHDPEGNPVELWQPMPPA